MAELRMQSALTALPAARFLCAGLRTTAASGGRRKIKRCSRVPGGLREYDRASHAPVAIEVWDASTRLPRTLLEALPSPTAPQSGAA
jgi:chloramphenicol 3-O-phosphotransferase